jgi:acetyl-CoA C-acetyltransferase
MNRPIIAATVRTAVGTYGGALRDISAPKLGAHAIRAALQRAGISPDRVDEVVMGNVLSAALGQGPARQAALDAGVSRDTPAMSVNMLCGSGLRAITLGAEMVALGRCEVVVAGGMESMSSAPFADMRSRWGARMGHYQLLDCVLTDGLEDAFSGRHMGELMDEYARQLGISRQAQDEYAAESQRRCEVAMAEGRFATEIEPLQIPQRKAEPGIPNTGAPSAMTTTGTSNWCPVSRRLPGSSGAVASISIRFLPNRQPASCEATKIPSDR